jgi:hypothetical protein
MTIEQNEQTALTWLSLALDTMAVGFMLWNPKGIVGSRLTFLRTRGHVDI